MRQYEGHNTPLGCCYYTDQGPQSCGQYDSQGVYLGVYCGLSTAPEVFLIFTSQLYH